VLATIYRHAFVQIGACLLVCVSLTFQNNNAWFTFSGVSPFTAGSPDEAVNAFLGLNVGVTTATAQQNFNANGYLGGSVVPDPDGGYGGGGGFIMNTHDMDNDNGGTYVEVHGTDGIGWNAQGGPDTTVHFTQAISDFETLSPFLPL